MHFHSCQRRESLCAATASCGCVGGVLAAYFRHSATAASTANDAATAAATTGHAAGSTSTTAAAAGSSATSSTTDSTAV